MWLLIIRETANEHRRARRLSGTGKEKKCQSLSHIQLFATSWTVAHKAPLSLEFSRQVYWSELAFPSPGELPDPGAKLRSPALQKDSLPTELLGKPHVAYEKRQIYFLLFTAVSRKCTVSFLYSKISSTAFSITELVV